MEFQIGKNNFDFLRMLMAVIVFVGHLGELSESKELFFCTYSPIHLAVFGFFVISGFLICMSYEKSSSLRLYFEKRVRRIFPAYYFVVFACAFFLSLMSTYDVQSYFTNPKTYDYLFWNTIFLNFKAPSLPGVFHGNAVNGALWTIKVELLFYITVPILFYLFTKMKNNKMLILLLTYIVSILYFNILTFLGKPILARQYIGLLSFFIAGMILYFEIGNFIKHKNRILIISLLLLLVDYFTNLRIFLPFTVGVVVLYLAYSFSFLNNFGKYGDFTYGIYITHFPIIHMVREFGFFKDYNPYLVGFLTLIFVIIVGVCSWNFVEKKFLNRRKRPVPKMVSR